MIFLKKIYFISAALLFATLSQAQHQESNPFATLYGMSDMTDQLQAYMEAFAANKHDNSSLKQVYTPRVITIFGGRASGKKTLSQAMRNKAEALGFSVINGSNTDDSKNILLGVASRLMTFQQEQAASQQAPAAVTTSEKPAFFTGKRMGYLATSLVSVAAGFLLFVLTDRVHQYHNHPARPENIVGVLAALYGLKNLKDFFLSPREGAAESVQQTANQNHQQLPGITPAIESMCQAAHSPSNHKILMTLHLTNSVDESFFQYLTYYIRNHSAFRNVMLVIFKDTDAFQKDQWVLAEGETPVFQASTFMPEQKDNQHQKELNQLSHLSYKTYTLPDVFLGKTACVHYLKNRILSQPSLQSFQNKSIHFDVQEICNRVPFIKASHYTKWAKTFYQAVMNHAFRQTETALASKTHFVITIEDVQSAYQHVWGSTL